MTASWIPRFCPLCGSEDFKIETLAENEKSAVAVLHCSCGAQIRLAISDNDSEDNSPPAAS